MNEKFAKVEVFVDTTNKEQLAALGAFLSTIGAMEVPVPIEEKKAPCEACQVKENPAPQPEAPKPTRTRTQTPKPKAEPQPEPVQEPAPEPALEPEEEKAKPAEKVYTIEEVRAKLKEKVSDHREEIKGKLSELGAPNVSSLNPDKYTEFVNFLEGLE